MEPTSSHSPRLVRYATALGVALNLPDADLVALQEGADLAARPLLAEIVGVVDAFDALTTAQQSMVAACAILLAEGQRGARPMSLVSAFVGLAGSRRFAHLGEDIARGGGHHGSRA